MDNHRDHPQSKQADVCWCKADVLQVKAGHSHADQGLRLGLAGNRGDRGMPNLGVGGLMIHFPLRPDHFLTSNIGAIGARPSCAMQQWMRRKLVILSVHAFSFA